VAILLEIQARISGLREVSMRGPGKRLALASLALGVLGLPTAGWLGVGALAAIGLGVWSLFRARHAPTADNGRELAAAGIASGLVSIAAAVPLVFLAIAWRESPDLWADRRILSEWPEPKAGVRPAVDPGWGLSPPPPPPPAASSTGASASALPPPPPPPPRRSTRREAALPPAASATAEPDRPASPPVAPEVPAQAPVLEAVRVGGRILEPKKIKDVRPVYPEIAKNARVQGIVILECRIGVDGRVEDVKILRGIPLLDEAASTAVRQWVYAPTLLDGQPVPVLMTVTVNFKLS
jgi:protein TonB